MLQPLRVLIVEDDAVQAGLVDEYLETAKPCPFGFVFPERRRVATLREALAAIAAEPFDAAVVDLGLPDAAGPGVVLAIRAAAPDLPIVAVTGSVDPDTVRSAFKARADDYIIKPGRSGATLRELIPEAISKAVLRRQRHYARAETIDAARELAAELLGPPAPTGYANWHLAALVSYCAMQLLMAPL